MLRFEDHGVRGGLWRGCIRGGQPPARVVLVQHGEVIAEARLTLEGQDGCAVEVDLPRELLTQGVQTLLLKADGGASGDDLRPDGQVLARLPLMAGQPLDDDLTAEIATLRAELELVKRELRRFAREQMGS